MQVRSLVMRTPSVALAALLFQAQPAAAGEVKVMLSGAFSAAYRELVPDFERATGHKVVTTSGGSMGSSPNTIPNRLERGEPADVVILAAPALDELIKRGKVAAGSRVDLARSGIGMVVRAGAPKPDISSIEALKRTIIAARSVTYSSSASGVYLTTELFPRLGLAGEIAKKGKVAEGGAAAVVARGEAEIGFQQVSELLPVPGVDYVGPLPPGAQQITIFSAGLVAGSREPEAARALIGFLASKAAGAVIARSGMEPASGR